MITTTMTRRKALKLMFGSSLGLPFCMGMSSSGKKIQEKPEKKKPNVVFIIADDLGIGDVGCYGSKKIKTPNIDKLAEQGIMALDAHATAAVCTPSRFAILTGRYYYQSWNGELLIKPEWNTLPSVLKENGYSTGYFGKWHLGWGENYEGRKHRADIDWNKTLPAGVIESGFDTYFGTPFTHNEAPSVFVENKKVLGLEADDPLIVNPPDSVHMFGKSTGAKKAHKMRPEARIDLMVTHRAKKWLKENYTKPFFMNLALVAPHVPLSPGKEFVGKTQTGPYGDFVSQMDWCVGEIIKTLDECGVSDNTMVIFTSDNGAVMHKDMFNQGHRSNLSWLGQKTDAWEGGIRIPFIVRWPGHIPAGTTTDALISLSDISKTIWDAVGVKVENDTAKDSISQLQVLLNPDSKPIRHEMLYLGIYGLALRSGDWVYIPRQGSCGITTGDGVNPVSWGMRLHELGQVNSDFDENTKIKPDAPKAQLYNLRLDPSQSKNVIRENPEKAAQLAQRYKQLHRGLY